jgi:hypothetical protein
MSRNGLNLPVGWIRPEGVRAALALKDAAVLAEMLEKVVALHAAAASRRTTILHQDRLALGLSRYAAKTIFSAIL